MEFEEWMNETFDEPEWDEGWQRCDLLSAFEAGQAAQREKDARILETTRGKVEEDGQIAIIWVNAKEAAKAIRES